MNRLLALVGLALLLGSCAPGPKPALEVLRWWWAQPFSAYEGRGYIRNNTRATFDTVRVVLDLYDRKGALLRRDSMLITELRPGEVGLFDADDFRGPFDLRTTRPRPANFRVVEIRGGTAAEPLTPRVSPSRIPRPMTPP